jgi:TATA-box binding protein (TBP) (component of TFIID and TFIIIB)
MNYMLNLGTVSSIAENKGCTVSFKPEIYSAVKLKFVPGPDMKKITASVFSSGCILITGAKTLSEITASYEFLIGMLRTSCMRPNPTLKKFKKFMGVPFAAWEKKVC